MKMAGLKLLSLIVAAGITCGQQALPPAAPAAATEESAVCKRELLPPDLQDRLNKEFGSWHIQEPATLSAHVKERWRAEKPLDCPGLAAGKFETDTSESYVVLLVPTAGKESGNRLVAFSTMPNQHEYEMKLIEASRSDGANLFIRRITLDKFFDEQSRRRFGISTKEGFLLVDSGENEYEADVYFWVKDHYQHEPVDY
jgi:hypothetical protein